MMSTISLPKAINTYLSENNKTPFRGLYFLGFFLGFSAILIAIAMDCFGILGAFLGAATTFFTGAFFMTSVAR